MTNTNQQIDSSDAPDNPMPPDRWTLDRHVPITMLIALLSQAVFSLWWIASFSAKTDLRIEMLEKQTSSLNQLPQRMSSLEAQLSATNQILRDIRDDIRSSKVRQ